MKSNKFFETFNFNQYLENYKEKIINTEPLKSYIDKNGTENLEVFSELFWENTAVGIKKLKSELDITNNIGYVDILRSFPNEKYVKLLEDVYVNNEEIMEKYCLSTKQMNELIFDLEVKLEEKYCKTCLNDSFYIENRSKEILCICTQCDKEYEFEELINNKEKELVIKEKQEKLDEFEGQLLQINEEIEAIKCPKCQNRLELLCDRVNLRYKIKCEKCDYNTFDYKIALADYN